MPLEQLVKEVFLVRLGQEVQLGPRDLQGHKARKEERDSKDRMAALVFLVRLDQ